MVRLIMEKRDYTKAAEEIAARVSSNFRTFTYVRDMDAPNRDPKKTRERFNEWVKQTVLSVLAES